MRLNHRNTMEYARMGPYGFLQADDLTDGPYPCEKCKEVSCYTHITHAQNRQFCKNEYCDFERLIDKRNMIIRESDGSFFQYDSEGRKERIRGM